MNIRTANASATAAYPQEEKKISAIEPSGKFPATISLLTSATFPLPSYGPHLSSTNRIYPDPNVRNRTAPFGGMEFSDYPTYPDSYRPNILSDSIFATDTALGFSGGDVAPMIIGSRFKIFDN